MLGWEFVPLILKWPSCSFQPSYEIQESFVGEMFGFGVCRSEHQSKLALSVGSYF
jgi:hypothetical protein